MKPHTVIGIAKPALGAPPKNLCLHVELVARINACGRWLCSTLSLAKKKLKPNILVANIGM